ncbi:fasciclin domain-containing protein [Persicitalea jodogahamensis]|uniref:Beta-Ig-H3/fasciclin domain-containing protein n=1 Tax=Persicitalea jodogahamensis TaxID=402147 RepID=A0A8J3D3G3_9BACT|nr:fasciclin domain-containing protein [Persicitalea jodogahamensis]GHB68364.1 beta-Ig-H3/fasciclin domain-containing protein [Persicitalea jodogahamensis]
MKRVKFFVRYATKLMMVGVLVGMVAACKNDDDNTVEPQSITDIVVMNNDFTILRAAVTRAGLADALDAGTLTVFAPNDAAFIASGIPDVAAVNALPEATLKSILEYHVLNSTVESSAIATAADQEVGTLGGQNLYITKNAGGVSVNGAMVIAADVDAANGVIHVIDRVLMPPTRSLLEIAQGNSDFSYLVAAVTRAAASSQVVVDALSSPGSAFTVFAPTNQAFIDAGFPTEASLAAADPATLTSILLYHVVPGRVFSTNLTTGDVATAATTPVKVDVGTGVTITGAGNGTNAASVTSANMLATNGVVHVIDRVLLP